MTRSFLLAARRSPVTPRNGALAHLPLHELAAPVLIAALDDAGIAPGEVEELLVANALGAGGNPARVIALQAGLPQQVGGLSIDRQCAGGLDAFILADALIRAGRHRIVAVGGAESYSRRPLRYHTFPDGREPIAYEQAPFTPWPDRDPDMAEAAQALAASLDISRREQDDWAIDSHRKAKAGCGDAPCPEIAAVAAISEDSFTRNLTRKHCDRAPVVSGSITAANMAVAADGAGFAIMAAEEVATASGGQPIEFIAGRTLGGDPELPGLAPVEAIQELLADAGLRPGDLSCAEIMEAFAVQAIACQRGAEIPAEIVNRKGGALARGHPIGASGAILATSLFHQLRDSGGTGLAAIAAAGGLGTAILMRR